MPHPFDDVTEATLRRRQSAKWKLYPADVLPLWVAEMDFPLAEPIRRVLHAAIDDDDCGYADPRGLGAAFAPWAKLRWGWDVAREDVHVVADVVTGIAELLRVATRPGDGVVIEPPVYPPFAATILQLERVVVEAPLARTAAGFAPDLEAIERAYAG
ncbi:MAG TPA: aminotransferase class I/II-fold pyridoxal phosphate-dependent enzyme, partial [Labilithrix sp.]|nr:aminotransferase class I/II-fold pyridoxal phosphate-dependent enzyme [Labilithrix sp.]